MTAVSDQASTPSPELQARVAQVLAPAYIVEGEVGRGGNGIVYRARDARLKRAVAVKVLPPELAYRSEIRTRFLQEAQTAAQLSHPNIVPIYTVDERDNLVYFVMAFIDGESLGAKLRATGPMAADASKRVLREVGQALAYAHARGVIHRDIKPDNILLSLDGRAMVTDFGIARAVDESSTGGTRLTATGMAIGTPAYMSPEQCAGDRTIDGRSDLYSLGVVGYQMLSGLPPFTGSSTPALLIKQISEAPVPLLERRPDVPPDLARSVMVLLNKNPADRFADANAFVAALDGGPIPNIPPPPAAAPAPSIVPQSRQPSAAGGFAAGFMAGEAVGSPGGGKPFTAVEIARFNAPPVEKFRKSFKMFVGINAALVVISLFARDSGFLGITGIWSVFIAYRYAKLWTDGFDWRDVFKQSRDRLFFDAAADAIDDARAMFDRKRRDEVRQRDRARLMQLNSPGVATVPAVLTGSPAVISGAEASLRDRARAERQAEKMAARGGRRPSAGVSMAPVPTASTGASAVADQEAAALVASDVLTGPHGSVVRRAVADRAAIRDIEQKLGAADRALLPPDLIKTVNGLVEQIASLATALHRLDGDVVPDALPDLDRRISACEGEPASPDRERKLTLLNRQRASLQALVKRRSDLYAQLENAALLLQNIRFDLIKLRSSGVQAALDDVTSATQEARALSREIGHVLNVAEELKAI
jgi:tRNA A-37 threonylcarbamoyl transferase component Bud32